MSLLQEEREIILSNEYVDAFDFAEVAEFVSGASKNLFISHHFRERDKMLVQPRAASLPMNSSMPSTSSSWMPMSMCCP